MYDIVECVNKTYVMEYLGECPEENAKECAEVFSKCMKDSAKPFGLEIKTDISITKRWGGEELSV